MEITAREVEDAVIQFYKNPDTKTEVHTWLTQAQHSTHAWSFAFQLLDPTKTGEVQFFGGNTLYIKVSRYWPEVPKEEYESLKRRLLEMVAQFADNKPIAGRLLKTLAAFVLNTLSGAWPTAVEELAATFNPETVTGMAPATALDLLFTLLTIIPDELENCHETMGLSRPSKNTLRGLLRHQSKQVLPLMEQVVHANQVSNVTKEIVIKALESWLRLPLPLSDTKNLLVSLIPYSNYGLLCESVVECLRTALSEYDGKSPQTTMDFILQLLQLTSVLDEAIHAEDETTASLVYGLFTCIVENHSRLLLKVALEEQGERRAAVLQLVSLLVQCSGTPGQYPTHETISNIPFSVWYTIQDDLMFFEGRQREQLIDLFQPIYLQLVDTFLHKSLLPADEALSAEEKELFRCYRQDICDSYMYTYFILKCRMLEQLEQHLRHSVARIQRDPDDWRPLEALLHAYASVAETVAESDTHYVPRFLESIPQIPFGENVHLITVALSTLGAYADWLNYHQEHLHHVIPLMMAGLVNERLVSAASQALRDLTLECPVTITPFASPILDACQKALAEFPQSESAVKERIITIIARVLSVGVPQQAVITHLNHTLTPIVTDIANIKDNVVANGSYSREERCQVVCQLKLLACLARHLNSNSPVLEVAPPLPSTSSHHPNESPSSSSSHSPSSNHTAPPSQPPPHPHHQHPGQPQGGAEQPLLLVLRLVLPLLDTLAETTATQPDVVEVLCKLLKNSLSTLLGEVEPLLPAILSMVPRLYYTSFHPAVLDVVKMIVILFGPTSSPHMEQMRALVDGTVRYTLQRVTTDLWNNTHVVCGVLLFATHLVKKLQHLLHPQHLHALFVLGIEALNLPEDGTVRAASSFMNHFLQLSRDYKGAMYEGIVRQNTEHFLRILITCICNSPRHSLTSISELLHALCKLYGGPELLAVFRKLEQDASFLPHRVTQQDKQKFSTAVMRSGNTKATIAAVTDLALVSRGVAGTEYGAATSHSQLHPYLS